MMIEEMDQTAQVASMSVQLSNMSVQGAASQPGPGDVNLQAFNFRGGRGRGFRRPFRASGGGRGGGGAPGGRGRGQFGRIWHSIYCGKCKGEGKPEAVFTAHNTINCPSLASISMEDRTDIIQALLASLTFEDQSNTDDYTNTEEDYKHQEADLFEEPQGQGPSS